MSPGRAAIDFVFFDIGGTLGDGDPATGSFRAYPSTERLLVAMRDAIGLRMGVITTLGADVSSAQGRQLLQQAGIADFLDPSGFVSDHEAGVAKPDARIYRFAAQQVGVSIERCLYVGENLIEVIGALSAGMHAVLKPWPPGRDLD